MNKKTIVLADNSYTIRRIVELSFSEEEDIELVSFENSLNLREELVKLKPAIVLVDIKLPEFSGYDVCRFINTTESLKYTRVFLLKGGFEPVDENQLKGLHFVDIITKPFDSNALVSTIKRLLTEAPAAAPSFAPEQAPPSMPEDLPEIDGIPDSDEEISFSDIKEEIGTGGAALPREVPSMGSAMLFSDDEVLPSEEITQGAQPERDSLSPPDPNAEDMFNPFKDETSSPQGGLEGLSDEELMIKKNIELQEKELEIGSLTQDELDIKRQIGEREKAMFRESVGEPAHEIRFGDEDTSELVPKAETNLDAGANQNDEAGLFEQPHASAPVDDSLNFGGDLDGDIGGMPDLGFDEPDDMGAEPPAMEYEIPSAVAPQETMPLQEAQQDFGGLPDLDDVEVEKEIGFDDDLSESPVTQRMEFAPENGMGDVKSEDDWAQEGSIPGLDDMKEDPSVLDDMDFSDSGALVEELEPGISEEPLDDYVVPTMPSPVQEPVAPAPPVQPQQPVAPPPPAPPVQQFSQRPAPPVMEPPQAAPQMRPAPQPAAPAPPVQPRQPVAPPPPAPPVQQFSQRPAPPVMEPPQAAPQMRPAPQPTAPVQPQQPVAPPPPAPLVQQFSQRPAPPVMEPPQAAPQMRPAPQPTPPVQPQQPVAPPPPAPPEQQAPQRPAPPVMEPPQVTYTPEPVAPEPPIDEPFEAPLQLTPEPEPVAPSPMEELDDSFRDEQIRGYESPSAPLEESPEPAVPSMDFEEPYVPSEEAVIPPTVGDDLGMGLEDEPIRQYDVPSPMVDVAESPVMPEPTPPMEYEEPPASLEEIEALARADVAPTIDYPEPQVQRVQEAAEPYVQYETPPAPEEDAIVEPSEGMVAAAADYEAIIDRVEDRLTIAVKELLWEILPPLAEKIIQAEVEKIKNEAAQTFK